MDWPQLLVTNGISAATIGVLLTVARRHLPDTRHAGLEHAIAVCAIIAWASITVAAGLA